MIEIDLSGRTALVTGAGTGLGAAMARTLGAAGAGVVVNYHRSREGAEQVAGEIRAGGGRAIALQADVTQAAAVRGMLERAADEIGPVTIVVNNAGREEGLASPAELRWSDYQRMLDLNLKSIHHTTTAALPAMRDAAWGRIINIGSVALLRPFPGSAAYSAAKGAMLGVTRALAAELGRDGVTVNLVAPGWVPVERHAGASSQALEKLARETPLGRCGKPEEVAAVVLFLSSNLASFVSGAQIPVNGGHSFFS